jgi:cytochrome c oxidase subunit IV
MQRMDDHHGFGIGVYAAVFAALLALLAATVWVSGLDLGSWNIFIAMGIAAVKAGLVVLYFMQARRGTLIIKVYAAAAGVWLMIATALTFADYLTRPQLKASAIGVVETVRKAPR